MNNLTKAKSKKYKVRTLNLYDPASKTPFDISRSKIDDFLKCPRCFYMDRRLGVAKPGTPPFQLNKAVDELVKIEFDEYRKKKEPHPIMKAAKINAIPFAHTDLNIWRDPFKGLRYHHKETNFTVFGGIDDVWQKPDGELIVLDYKATWKMEQVTLEDEWKDAWKRQLEVYQWLFRKNGFRVANLGYFISFNALVDEKGFNNLLRFTPTLLPYEGNDSWIEPTLGEARNLLTVDKIPDPHPDCDYCAYRKESAQLAQKFK